MIGWLTPRNAFVAALLAILVLLPVYAAATGNTFLMTLFTRIVILAIAAVSLNLIMGFGGMVSFGHAAYLGIGGYAVGILAKEGVDAGLPAVAARACRCRRCSRSASARCRCARAASISS